MINIDVNIWGFVFGIIVTVIGSVIAVLKIMYGLSEKRMDLRFSELHEHLERSDKAVAGNSDDVQRVERELQDLKLKLADEYVRREDYVRGQLIIEGKLDKLAELIYRALGRGGKGDKNE